MMSEHNRLSVEREVSSNSSRDSADIINIIKCAKLDADVMSSECQSIEFSDNLQSDSTRLLELDKDMMNYLQEGNRVVIRGLENDEAVVCTKEKTYTVRLADTSNTMLLLPHVDLHNALPPNTETIASQSQPISGLHVRKVHGVLHTFIELRPCRGRIQRLQQLLQECPYTGKEYEADKPGKKYTLSELLDVVQASEAEILLGLSQLHACHIGGYYRLLSQEYTSQVLDTIINFIEENSWTYQEIKVDETLDTLQELHPRDIIYHCLNTFGCPNHMEESNDPATVTTYSLDEVSICRFFAKDLLMFVGKFNYDEFLSTWQQTVPKGMTISLTQINDLCLVDKQNYPPTISYFPLHQLPEAAADRFNFLFKTRERWTKEEIEPFIKDLCDGVKLDVNALLTKYTRSTVKKGVKLYNSRRPVN